MMAAGAARGRTDGRHILGVKCRGRALEMKIRPALQQADATIPAENAVVIAGRANFFRFGEAAHGFFDQRQKDMRSVPHKQLCLSAALVEQAAVIVPLVGVAQILKNGLDFRVAIAGSADELVSDGQAEHTARKLVVGIDSKNVVADGFRFFGLVKVTVELAFGDGLGNSGFGNGFQLVLHWTSFQGPVSPQ